MIPGEWDAWRELELRLCAEVRTRPRRSWRIRGTARRWLWTCLDAYARAYFPTELVGRIDAYTPTNLPTDVPFPP